ncbi:MAG: Adenylate cyclase [Candidatus Eremiobacteraeota bacterium]|nr:Adenylate cyclase [Candidatus Eremiobacteraeota bacterium]
MGGSETPAAELFLFGPFALDGFARTLRSHDLAVPVPPQTFELLDYLVRNAGRSISNTEILDAWPGEEVTEGSLAAQMLSLRGTLARHSPRATYIVAEPGGGYRFVARVVPREPGTAEDSEANRLYARGRYFYDKRTADSLHRSIHYFRQAVELDPTLGRAYAGLSAAFALTGEYLLMAPAAAFPRAADAARRALQLDPTLDDAHAVLGVVALRYDRDFERAERHFAQAAALAPQSSNIVVARAWFLCIVGRAQEAAQILRDALHDEPYSLILETTLAVSSIFRREYGEAIRRLRAVREMDAGYVHGRFYLAVAMHLDGRFADALALSEGAVPDGYEQQFMALRGRSLAGLGRVEEARAIEDGMRALVSRGRYVSCFNLAWLASGLGESEHAVRLLEAGFEEHDPWTVFVPEFPLFDSLRGDPRFEALSRRIH